MIFIVLPTSIFVVPKDNKSSLGSVKFHIGVTFDCEGTHQWNGPGGYLCSKLLIFLDVDILSCFHLIESVLVLGVSIKPSLVIS